MNARHSAHGSIFRSSHCLDNRTKLRAACLRRAGGPFGLQSTSSARRRGRLVVKSRAPAKTADNGGRLPAAPRQWAAAALVPSGCSTGPELRIPSQGGQSLSDIIGILSRARSSPSPLAKRRLLVWATFCRTGQIMGRQARSARRVGHSFSARNGYYGPAEQSLPSCVGGPLSKGRRLTCPLLPSQASKTRGNGPKFPNTPLGH
jgi:hypothetical protein